MVKMSSDGKTIKPKTDFELVLNYSNQRIWKNLNNDPGVGAGANAACRVDKTFSATDPLSEIVWSPDKGFSLKCVDSSFSSKKTSLFGDVEPSSMVLALLQTVTDPASDSVIIIPDHETCEDDHDTGFDDNMEKMNTESETHNLPNSQKENVMNDLERNLCAQANIGTAIISEIKGNKSTISGQVDERPVSNLLLQANEPKCSMEENPSPRKHCNGGIDTGVVNQVVEIEDGLHTSVEHAIECKGSGAGALGTNLISSGISPSQKLESAEENDLQAFNFEPTCAATSAVLVSKSSEDKNKVQVNEKMLLCSKNFPVMPSPCNSRIQMTRNEGKEKSSSYEDSNVSLSKEEECHLSVESFHSAGLVLAGKKRSKFQQVIIGSKKFKKQTQETSFSKSCVKPDSSFMNLISNMIKGCSQSTQDEDKSLALNLENPNHHHHLQQPDQKLLMFNKNQDPERKNAGFRSNFQSMAGAKFKNVGTRMSQAGEASKDFELGTKVYGIDAAPISFYAENNNLYRQCLQSNKLENCYNLGVTKEKEGVPLLSLHSPSTRQNRNNNENIESDAVFERKEICNRNDNVEDLWMNRFLPKSTPPLVFFDHLNASCAMLPHSNEHNCKIEEAREESSEDQLLSEAKNLHICYINKEDSTVLKDDKGNQYHTEKPHKFNSFTPSQGLRDSGPMVSMFARRLGAIKQFQYTE